MPGERRPIMPTERRPSFEELRPRAGFDGNIADPEAHHAEVDRFFEDLERRNRAAMQANRRAHASDNIPARLSHDASSSFDITKFLSGLPRIDVKDIAGEHDSNCPVCAIRYGDEDPDTGFHEHAIRLPCGHISGKACIIRWLKPGPKGGNGNTCPICRREFFKAWPRRRYVPPAQTNRNAEAPTRIRARSPAPNVVTGVPFAQAPATIGSTQVPANTGTLPGSHHWYSGSAQRQEPTTIVPSTVPPSEGQQSATPLGRSSVGDSNLPRHGFPAAYLRILRDAGFDLASFTTGLNSTDRHEQVRQTIREQVLETIRANRARVTITEKDLYETLVARGVQLPGPRDVIRREFEEVGGHQEEALFKWLRDMHAFRHLRLNEDLRTERVGSNIGHNSSDAELWMTLRDWGFSYRLAPEGRRHGRWYGRIYPLYDEEVEVENDTFQNLIEEGAFETPSIRREFPGQDHYFMYRRVLSMGATWNSERGIWVRRNWEPAFGEEVYAPQQQEQTHSPRAQAGIVQHDHRGELAQHANSIRDFANGLTVNLAIISDRDQANTGDVVAIASDIRSLRTISDRILAAHARMTATDPIPDPERHGHR